MSSKRRPLDPSSRTLGEMTVYNGTVLANERALIHIDGKEREWPQSHGEVLLRARKVAAALQARGLEPGERVMIMLPSGSTFCASFLGTVLAGGVPVPLYPPYFLTQIEDFLARYEPIAIDCQASFLITFKDVSVLAAGVARVVPRLRGVLLPDDLNGDVTGFKEHLADPEDTCFLQYTSGSTGMPKGVVISHKNIMENVYGIGLMVDRRPDDVTVSWLPMYHDMGLIGGLLCSLFWSVPIVLLSPQQFVKYPVRWLRAISKFRGTFSPAPNFAYRLCLKIEDELLEGLDLSSWRVAFNGAEPVDLETLDRFVAKFQKYGFKPTTPFPVYGAAEATLAITHPQIETRPIVEYVERASLSEDQAVVRPCAAERPEAVACVSVGRPMPFTEIAITDPTGGALPERHVGEIRVRGPAIMKGYHNNPAATARAIQEGWLCTGDLGYVVNGNLFITGRKKDLIIKNGKNFYPQDFEDPARRVEGVNKGGLVAFGDLDEESGTERIVLLAETSVRDEEKQKLLRRAIIEQVAKNTGVAPDLVVLLRPRSILKTSSGKVRRAEARALWKSGELGRQRPTRQKLLLAVTAASSIVQLTRLKATPMAHHLLRTVLGVLGLS